jgi:SAM-dependent methyltransferase
MREENQMSAEINLDDLRGYFKDKLKTYGTTPGGADWNSVEAQELRFEQLSRIIRIEKEYDLIDYGSGFGKLYDYLRDIGHQMHYYGFDFLPEMVEKGCELHPNDPTCHFTTRENELPTVDYVIASGIFNIRLNTHDFVWTEYVLSVLDRMDQLSKKGFAFNMLTKYSDLEYMKPQLYYADPCFFFDYCKQHYARNVALLHDYGLYDFTILVRKELG